MRKIVICLGIFFFFKQKTAYEIGTGDWSSDVCSSDLHYYIGVLSFDILPTVSSGAELEITIILLILTCLHVIKDTVS